MRTLVAPGEGEQPEPRREPAVGDVFVADGASWRVEAVLAGTPEAGPGQVRGEGAVCRVCRVTHNEGEREVRAAKFWRNGVGLPRDVHERLRQLSDPERLLAVGSGGPIELMPLYTGGDLAQLIERRRKPLPGGPLPGWPVAVKPSDIRLLRARLEKALELLHSAGLCHGDVKPDNILLPAPRDWKHAALGDFGQCRPLTEANRASDFEQLDKWLPKPAKEPQVADPFAAPDPNDPLIAKARMLCRRQLDTLRKPMTSTWVCLTCGLLCVPFALVILALWPERGLNMTSVLLPVFVVAAAIVGGSLGFVIGQQVQGCFLSILLSIPLAGAAGAGMFYLMDKHPQPVVLTTAVAMAGLGIAIVVWRRRAGQDPPRDASLMELLELQDRTDALIKQKSDRQSAYWLGSIAGIMAFAIAFAYINEFAAWLFSL